ncbi:MAG TPA: VOC family protein [Pararobbsia sp.]|jgi:catechol 2,3-dioxygenase-like lactoylglutathione lyase family enzyme|nr:VOC family protein [Pararobbsia sp.]
MTTDVTTQGIHHLGLTVRDLAMTRAFFVDCLGWKQVGEKPDYPAVFVSDGTIMFTLWQVQASDGGKPFDRKTNVGLHHVALRVNGESAFRDTYERVSKWPGVTVEFAPEKLGAGPIQHMMITEPGGIRIEFDFDPRVTA